MTGDASIAGDAYPVDAPGLAPSGVHAIQTFCILELSFLWIYDFWLTLGYTTFIFNTTEWGSLLVDIFVPEDPTSSVALQHK